MPTHDSRIDDVQNLYLRTLLLRTESFLHRLRQDPELFPVIGALCIATLLWVGTGDWQTAWTLIGPHINFTLAFIFLLGAQYGRIYWGRKKRE